MEDNLRTNFREHSIHGSTKAMKDPWSSFRDHRERDYLLGLSWPPRSYTCSFCKREFRSAQALGGHMNVHRRDRARLRLQSSSSSSSSSPPPPPPTTFTGSPFLNPNPIFSPPSLMGSSSSSPPLLTLIPPPSSSPLSLSASTGVGKALLANSLRPKFKDSSKNVHKPIKPSLVAAEQGKGLTTNDSCKFLKKGEIISLELEIGLIHDSKQDLDLELRLGLA